jgi:HAD superfamily hydrolase (TIGR01549 family)
MKFTGITTIIWDLDNTLYRRNPQLQKDLRDAEISVICRHTGWDRHKAITEFENIHKSVYQSATEASAHLAHIPIPQAAREMEEYFDRVKFLSRDAKLLEMFKRLNTYDHFILTNGVIEQATKAIDTLGLSPTQFKEIVTSEQTGVNKPDPAGFLYILKKTAKPASSHLMVGDRDEVDIEPAKRLGIKTCFVWGESSVADTSLPTVYEIADILT